MAKKMTIDQGFDSLEEIIEKLFFGSCFVQSTIRIVHRCVPLVEKETHTNLVRSEICQLYGKGIEMIKQLKEKLDATEKKIIVLEEE